MDVSVNKSLVTPSGELSVVFFSLRNEDRPFGVRPFGLAGCPIGSGCEVLRLFEKGY